MEGSLPQRLTGFSFDNPHMGIKITWPGSGGAMGNTVPARICLLIPFFNALMPIVRMGSQGAMGSSCVNSLLQALAEG